MSNVVFILGAGASKQAGAPLMADFLDVASHLLLTGAVNDRWKADFEQVFAAIGGLQAVHSKAQLDLNNIESVFTALELGRVIQRVPGLKPTQIPQAIASLKALIVQTLELTMRFPAEGSRIGVPRPYAKFAELVRHLGNTAFPARTVSVITFNYDVAADIALYKAELGPRYRIADEAPTTRETVDLLKLHGSLNWAIETGSNRIRPLHLRQYLQTYSGVGPGWTDVRVPIGSRLVEYFSRHAEVPVEVQPEPVIVPPSWNKADYHSALSDVWAAAASHLAEAEYIFIAGYSLPETDSFFKHLFALGSVGKSALRRLVIYNPDRAVDERFRHILGPGSLARYSFEQRTFEDAISEVTAMFPKRS